MNDSREWKWCDLPVDDADIQKVEFELKIKFPEDYIQLVRHYNGGYPSQKFYDAGKQKDVVIHHLLSLKEGGEDPSLVMIYRIVSDRLPKGIVPFASDPFGNLICFDYNTTPPSVCYWNHEVADADKDRSIVHISNSVSELMDMLRE